MRKSIGLFAGLVSLLAACAVPPPDAYIHGSDGTRAGDVSIGTNAAGEACTAHQAGASGVDIFCGKWVQPSAEIRRAGAVPPGGLANFAAASSWRAGLDQRFVCATPSATRILGGSPAVVLQCTRRLGGWPQVALAADIGGSIYAGDGILPSLPVMERGMGVLSGRLQPGEPAPRSEMDSLLAARLAAQAFRSGDIGQYDALVNAGNLANLAENFAAAEQAFRAALALQQRVMGRNNPNAADALMHLALQISDQGRYPEAEALFARAEALAPRAADPVAPARLLQYRALNAFNQHHAQEALALLHAAAAAYAALLPPDVLNASATAAPRATLAPLSITPNPRVAGAALFDPAQRTALMGLIETRRYEAAALRELHSPAESEAALRSAFSLAAANGLEDRFLTARLYRTAGITASDIGATDKALAGLGRSAADFRLALPGARPLAETELLRAAELSREGSRPEALLACREAVTVLRRLRAGVRPGLIEPCLDLYAAAAKAAPAAQQQPLLAEMFEAAQLAVDSVTAREIAVAAARLGENARDPRVGAAIRQDEDATRRLSALYHARDVAGAASGGATAAQLADLDKRIHEAQQAVFDAGQTLQTAAPNFGQLVQEVASAAAVQHALDPAEAFAAVILSDKAGWTFAVRKNAISVARVPGGREHMAALVARLRAGAEPTTAALPRYDTAAALEIYQDTLGRVATSLEGAKSLVVAPTGPLLSIPFGVLLTGPADPDHLAGAPWLLRRFTISHVPAAANFVALRKIAGGSRATAPWFGFGNFVPATFAQASRTFPGAACGQSAKLFAGLPPLPYSVKELQAARLLLGAPADDEMLGPQFTAAAVRNAQLDQFHILHFAAHALLPAELRCESEPAIITSTPRGAPTADGALLTASVVTGLKLDADVVILSACNSGGPGGAGTGGESLSGLARAFFYAGARSMLVTHWSVNDQAAAYLIADTLRRLRAGEGGGIAGALRDAQLGMLDGAGKGLPAQMAHPFFWGPFALIGNGTTQPFAPARRAAVSPRAAAAL